MKNLFSEILGQVLRLNYQCWKPQSILRKLVSYLNYPLDILDGAISRSPNSENVTASVGGCWRLVSLVGCSSLGLVSCCVLVEAGAGHGQTEAY